MFISPFFGTLSLQSSHTGFDTTPSAVLGVPEPGAILCRLGWPASTHGGHLFVAPIVVGSGKPSLPDDVRVKLELLPE